MAAKKSNSFVKFKFPFDVKEIIGQGNNHKVCVVSIFGKSSNQHSKASVVNSLINRDVFLGASHDAHSAPENLVDIEGHYDETNRIVFLHLVSGFDTSTLTDLCQKSSDQINETGYHGFLQSVEFRHACALLYIFSISHIILMVHPGSSFDVSFVRLFRILETVRQKMLPSISDCLYNLGVSKDWVNYGRLCSPRVLFVFQSNTMNQEDDTDQMVMSKTRSQKTPPIKRLQHAIEDQIYRILRKSRIITNISNNSLFAVPANQEFVYVFSQKDPLCDQVTYYLNQLQEKCTAVRDMETPRSHSYQTNRRGGASASTSHHPTEGDAASRYHGSSATRGSHSTGPSETNSFKEFLWQHVDLAFSKGFDDNVGRNPIPAMFELPYLHTWLEVCSQLYDFFLIESESRSRPHFNTLKSLIEVDGRFSELRCNKVLPMAEGAYREGLPHHYTHSYHLNKLQQAEQVFKQHARGPNSNKYKAQLRETCEKVWLSRQQCEETSLTGKPCVHPLHKILDLPDTDSTNSPPVMAHSSQVKTKGGCNCGRIQDEREDPFSHKNANYDFYQSLETKCCASLEHYDFPVFHPSTSEAKAGVYSSPNSAIPDDSIVKQQSKSKSPQDPATETPEDGQDFKPARSESPSENNSILYEETDKSITRKDSKMDIVPGMSGLSIALSLGQSVGSDLYGQNNEVFAQPGSDEAVTEEEQPLSPLRQVSTTEYLPGMIHSDSPAGLLPKFSSWSLVCLGKPSVYSPSQGLDQPGLIHGNNYLLPWDVTVTPQNSDKWPVVGEPSGGKKGRPLRKPFVKESGEHSYRLYIGYEYECPRGHCFFLSSPDRIFKGPPGNFKESIPKIIDNDMPLYFPCPCRSPKGNIGHLTRLYAVVPEGNIQLKLQPRIRPHPVPCPTFYPTPDGACLRAGMWILRFPYVYLGETGSYVIPTDPHSMAVCLLMKGALSVTATN